jgi:hypothetical protein
VPTKAAIWSAAAASGRGCGLAGGGRDGDAAAPGIGGLSGAAVGIGQRVAGWHVHEQERRQHDGEAALVQVLDGGDDAGIGRRAAIGGAAFVQADEDALAARQAGNRPGERRGDLVVGIDAGADLAFAGAQVGAEPAAISETAPTLGSVACSWSSETDQSVPPCRVCTFSAMLVAAPTFAATRRCRNR